MDENHFLSYIKKVLYLKIPRIAKYELVTKFPGMEIIVFEFVGFTLFIVRTNSHSRNNSPKSKSKLQSGLDNNLFNMGVRNLLPLIDTTA